MILVKKKDERYFISSIKKVSLKVWLLCILLIIAGFAYYRMFTIGKTSLEDQMKEFSKQVQAPELKMDIKFKNLQKLLFQRKQALRSGGTSMFNYDTDFTEVPAKITYEGKEYKADIRLKGLRKHHFADSTRMSYHVKLKGDKTIMGMRKFSLHDPKMRNYIYEWLFHKLLKREKFITLQYDFINVRVNGSAAGIYAIEERMDKILLERHGYTDGPIFKLADDADYLFHNTVEPFSDKKYNSAEWKAVTNKAQVLATGLITGRFKFGQIVNADMFARYFAVCDILMNYHGFLLKSVRAYYNPVTGKFEPIGFDGHIDTNAPHFISSEVIQRINTAVSYFSSITTFQEFIFCNENNYDREFLTSYVKYLRKYSSVKFLDSVFRDIAEELTEKLATLYKNQPLLFDNFNSFGPEEFKFSKKHVIKQARYTRNLLNFKTEFAKIRVSSKINKAKMKLKSFELKVSNNYALSLILKNVVINDSVIFYPTRNDFIIPSRYSHVRNYKKFNFKGSCDIPSKIHSTKLNFQIAGMDSLHFVDIDFYTDELGRVMQDIIRTNNNIEAFSEFIIIDKANNIISFKKGEHTIDHYIKIPKGYKVVVNSGTELNFTDSAFLLSYSPLIINGSASDPIKITSDKTGGIAVFDCDSTSLIRNIVFNGLSYPRSDEWKLTGAVTFYKSPVIIENVKFRNNLSEDYLNIKQTKFRIQNSEFKNVSSDAFDSDFCSGIIENTKFKKITNDAIDVSGTKVNCKNIEVDYAGDKAFSAGEGSAMVLEQVKISNSEIAVASKDRSTIEINGIDIINCKVGYTAYQKKSEWGSGKIKSTNSSFTGEGKELLIEQGSEILLNGSLTNGNLKNVAEDYLYGKKYGSKSIR